MIDEIILSKDGFFISEYNENLKQRELVRIDEPIWYYYNYELILGENVSFGDAFIHLEPFLDKLEEHFLADTNGWGIQEWFEEIKKDQTKKDTDFFEIRFQWIIDASSIFNRRTSKFDNSFSKYLTFSAMAKSKENEGEEDRYGISFIDIQNLRDLPLAFDKHCEFSLFNDETGRSEILFEFEDGISLREFIACLFNEVTFYGNPEETNIVLNEIRENIDEDDETQYTSFSAFRLELLEEELKEALSEENFEWAENVRIEIEQIKNEDL